MGIQLSTVKAQYEVGHLEEDESLTTARLREGVKAIAAAKPDRGFYLKVFGDPVDFWKKSSPFSAITGINYYPYNCSGSPVVDFVIEVVCVSDKNTERRVNKWTRKVSELLGLKMDQVALTIVEV